MSHRPYPSNNLCKWVVHFHPNRKTRLFLIESLFNVHTQDQHESLTYSTMRPFAIRLAQGQNAAKETINNGEPPASTLAAQIVDDLTRGKNHPKHQDQERFRSLLREILDTNNEDGDVITQGIEKNTNVNCRLIYVVIRAGLEASFNGDPFEKQDELNKQAVESLSVVQLTLRRCPEVLFTVLERGETDLQLDGPLYLWLVPRLFTILGHNEDREVRLGVLRVLQTTLLVGRKGHLKQIKFQLVLKYIQGCVKGQATLIYLQSF